MERRSPWAVALGSWAVVLSSDAVGLGALRSLQAGGVPTIAVMLDSMEPARFSRFGHKIHVPKTGDVEGAILEVLSGIQQEPRPVLIPTSDLLAHLVAKHRVHLEERFRCCIPPDAVGECMGLFDGKHDLVRAFTFRKLATMPAHFGATSRARSERNDALLELAATVGRRVGYVGLGDIDVKYDARDGKFKYLELNPRLGLCHWFGTRCGINLTLDAYRQMCGEEIRDGSPQLDGLTFLSVLEQLGGGLHDGDSMVAVVHGLLSALRHRPGGPYFAWNDPLPGPMAGARSAHRLLSQTRRGRA